MEQEKMTKEEFFEIARKAGFPKDVAEDGWSFEGEHFSDFDEMGQLVTLELMKHNKEEAKSLYPDSDWDNADATYEAEDETHKG